MTSKRFEELSEDWIKDSDYRKAYEALEEEFSLTKELISARVRAHLTQRQMAERMQTKQSFISKLESGNHKFNLDTLARYAEATGSKIEIRLIGKHPG
jgi:predicted XRE-type DNA-binding protein